MREKEARDVRENLTGQPIMTLERQRLLDKSEGYLEAIEKAKDVVETLKLYENLPCSCRLMPGSAGAVKRCDGCFTREALVRWEKEALK